MNNDIETNLNPNSGKLAAGTILLIIGSILLIREFEFFNIPDWVFSWPMWMISWGLYMGAKYNWRKTSWVFITLVGLACLLDENIAGADRVIWPVAVMGFGAWLILKPKKQKEEYYFGKQKETFHFDKTTEPEV